jgi:hypothetical protein
MFPFICVWAVYHHMSEVNVFGVPFESVGFGQAIL